MSWEAVSALSSILGALILIVGTIAAVIQLKHLRMANQLGSYLQLMAQLHSTEMMLARKYVETVDLHDPEALREATTPDLDNRIRILATHYQTVARLLNRGVVDEDVFAAHVVSTPHLWNAIAPAIDIIRKRVGVPLFVDFEYLAYRSPQRQTVSKFVRTFPKEFVDARIAEYLE